MNLGEKIYAILFWRGEPILKKRLAEILSVKIQEIDSALEKIKEANTNRGVVLVEKNDEVMLGTAPELSELFENLQKEELNKDLSKASLETLSIILYKNGATRAEIDYIRGVNSTFTLRALSVRGLVERIVDPVDARRFLYRPTFDLLQFMGVKNVEELPGYSEIHNQTEIAAKNLEQDSSTPA